MLERRARTKPANPDGYKIKRAAYSMAAAHSHELQCGLFGKPFEPIPFIQARLNEHLRVHTINKMKHEIDEINGGGDDGRG